MGSATIAIVILVILLLLGISGLVVYLFWDDIFSSAPAPPPVFPPSPPPDLYSPSPDSSQGIESPDAPPGSPDAPPGSPGAPPGYTGSPGAPPGSPGGYSGPQYSDVDPLEMLEESAGNFTLKRLSDEKRLEETGWKLIMRKDGEYRWNYHHKGNDGGFIFNNNAGGNHAFFNKKPEMPTESEIHLSERYGSEDKPYWFFKLWSRKSWVNSGKAIRVIKYYRITPHDDNGTKNCLTFESDDGPAAWRACERDENSEAFKKQVYFLEIGG